MVIDGLGVAFVMEGEVEDTVGELVGAEAFAGVLDFSGAFADEGLVVLLLIDLLAPTVIDGEDVGQLRVHVLDSEHIVLAVAVRCDDIGEFEVGLNIDHVGHTALATLVGGNGEGDGVFTPLGVGMFAVDVVGLLAAVAVVPGPMLSVIGGEDTDIGKVEEGDVAAFTEVGAFGVGHEVGDGLRIDVQVVGFGGGVGTAVLCLHIERDGIDTGILQARRLNS